MKFKVSHIFGLHKNLRLLTLLGFTRQATKRGCWVGPHFPFWPPLYGHYSLLAFLKAEQEQQLYAGLAATF